MIGIVNSCSQLCTAEGDNDLHGAPCSCMNISDRLPIALDLKAMFEIAVVTRKL
jgi:hypothetical protein